MSEEYRIRGGSKRTHRCDFEDGFMTLVDGVRDAFRGVAGAIPDAIRLTCMFLESGGPLLRDLVVPVTETVVGSDAGKASPD